MPEIISRKDARARGLKRYFTGEPCSSGHFVERNLGGRCLECFRIYRRDRRRGQAVVEQQATAGRAWAGWFTCIEEVDEYFDHDTLTCMICGKGGFAILTKHLRPAHGMSAAEYRQRYRIPTRFGLAGRALRDHIGAVTKARAIGRVSKAAPPDWDRFLDRLRSGEKSSDLYGQPGMPTFGQANWRRQSERGFREEMATLLEGRRGAKVTRATIEKVKAGLSAGRSQKEVVADLGRTTALSFTLKKRMTADPVFAAQFDGIWSTRAVRGMRDRSRADWAGFEQRIASGLLLKDVLGTGGAMPTIGAWHGERRRNPELAERVHALISETRRQRRIARPASISAGESLERYNSALRSDEMYGAVHAATRRLPPDIRDDVISDLVLALMCGEISVADLPHEVGRFRAAHNRAFGQWTPSLDAPIFEGRTIGDTLSAAYF